MAWFVTAVHTLDWRPYMTPVALESASPEQREALKTTPSGKKISAYVLTLAHDPEMLGERTPLFNDIMYVPGGLSRDERELGSLVASVMNRCAQRDCPILKSSTLSMPWRSSAGPTD